MLLDDFTELVHLRTRVEVSGRIVRVADKDCLCALCDEFLELFYWREGESGLDCGCNGLDYCSGRHRKCHIVGVCRLRYDDFISRVQTCEECEEYRLGAAAGDDDIIRRKVDVELAVVFHKFLSQGKETLARTVLEHCPVNVLESVKGLLRSRKVRLSDVQMVYLDASCLCVVGKRSEFSDRR